MSEPEKPWSVPIQLAEIPAGGRHVELRPDAATREAIAVALGVVALPRLEAVFDLVPLAKDGVRVSGSVSASVEQNCVVTLEPLLNQVEERVDLILVRPGAAPPPRTELDIDVVEDSGAPDVLHDDAVDLGEVATEFLLLGIDPYPRQPGANFELPQAADNPATHPFAALAALNKDSGAKSR